MSHPTSHKEISSNPSATAVTSPTDPKLKAKDIDNKMRFYGIVSAMGQGKYPSNNQIEKFLQYALTHSPIDQSKLSKDGKELISDFQSVIETARQMVAEKNQDELFQNFLYSTRFVDASKLNPQNAADAPISKEEARQDGEQAAENLKTLAKLIYTNSEFRKILKDIGLLARDVAADAAAKAAETARPSEQQLKQIDETAPDNQWVTTDGQVRGPNDAVPDTGVQQKREQAQQAKEEAFAKKEELKQQAQAEGQAQGRDAAQRVDGAVSSQPGDSTRGPSVAEQEAGKREAANIASEKQNQAKAKLEQVKGQIPEERKEQAREYRGKAVNYAKEKFPEERQERFIYRLKKVVVENQRHGDYQEAIEFFISLAENYKGHAANVGGQTAGHASSFTDDPAFKAAYLNFRTLLERFANNTSMQPMIDSIDQIYRDVDNDPALRKWFSELNTYIRNVLLEPGYVMEAESDKEARRLRDNGQGFFSERYRPHREAFVESVERFFTAYADDPLNVQFGEDWKRLVKDLTLDESGNLAYKPQLWQDIRAVILPQLLQGIGYVPIPRVEYTDNQIDLVIENLTLEAANIIPNIIEMEVKNYFKLSAYDQIANNNKHSFWISFEQIQTDLKDVAFYFKKKSGFPRISDSGLADVFIGGNGISGKIHLESTGRKHHVFKVRDVDVKIDNLKFKIRDAKHQFLYSMVRPLATSLIKKAVPKAIEAAIRDALEQLDAQLSDIAERIEDADGREDVSRSEVVKDVFAKKKESAQQKAAKAEEKTGQFKIPASHEDRILEWESKQSMLRKQEERDSIAQQLPGWKSPIFDIVAELEGKSLKQATV